MDYNARYYSPVLGRFVSPDTMIQEPGQGRGFNRYRYARNNPLKYTDPSGHFIETVWDVANVAIGVGSMAYNLSQGNYTDAAIDAGGLVVDVAATIVPGVPGGASAAIKAIRAGDKGADLLRYATKADDAIEAGLKYSDEATGFIDEGIDAVKQACSFSPDTLVATDSGFIPIGEIIEGEYVLAYNEATGEIDYYPVTAVWSEAHQVVVYLTLDGELLETTPEHPFHTAEGEWLAAAELTVGDQIRRADGRLGQVEALEFVLAPQPMYNLTVAEAHTYFVGQGQWLVHNACPKKVVRKPNEELKAPPPKRGDAPIGDDGKPIELHHDGQNPDSPLIEMTRTEHRGKGNFKKNHSNTGQKPSKIDRKEFNTLFLIK